MGTMIKKQIGEAGFDTKDLKISGTSLRKNMFDSMLEHDVPSAVASSHGGHRNLQSKESYISKTNAAKKAVNKIMVESIRGENTERFQDILEAENKREQNGIDSIVLKENKILDLVLLQK